MTVRAKFVCSVVEHVEGSDSAIVCMKPVIDDSPENKTWSKYTPGGSLEMYISNPDAVREFTVGAEYLIDITQVEKATS
ncbi:hypothetical protein [Citrobacter amalonaticus]|uniref:hypothetical protein n=1 Tax=Citrobacter amalonaticus TaxID=35703 RepID=UPI0006964976|nr:hypothetical protein [Citrobacter amalonaticus]